MSEWVSTLLRWESASAKPGLQPLSSSGALGDGRSEYTPNNSSRLVGDETVFAGQQGCFCDGSGGTAKPSRSKAVCRLRALVASGHGANVRVSLRGRRCASRGSAVETGMDGQPSSDGIP